MPVYKKLYGVLAHGVPAGNLTLRIHQGPQLTDSSVRTLTMNCKTALFLHWAMQPATRWVQFVFLDLLTVAEEINCVDCWKCDDTII